MVERFAYLLLSEAEGEENVSAAQGIKRLAVGLRRKLDNWKE